MKPNMTLKMATCVVAVIGLSGCQSMLSKLGFNSSASPRSAMVQAIGEPDLVAGQESLRVGNIGQAIISFRLASLDPGSQADASNGLGIAYARLGRADLAERYFLQATELAPLGEKYAANLVRFYESDLARSAQAKALRVQQAELTRVEDQPVQLQADMAETPRTARRGPIMVRTLGESEGFGNSARKANNQARPSRGVIQVVQRSSNSTDPTYSAPDKRMASASKEQSSMIVGSRNIARYPVRVDIDDVKDAAPVDKPETADKPVAIASRSKTIRPAYPIRLELETNSGSR